MPRQIKDAYDIQRNSKVQADIDDTTKQRQPKTPEKADINAKEATPYNATLSEEDKQHNCNNYNKHSYNTTPHQHN